MKADTAQAGREFIHFLMCELIVLSSFSTVPALLLLKTFHQCRFSGVKDKLW